MKKLFKKIMNKIEAHFLNRAGIAITLRPLLKSKELNIREFTGGVYISNKTLREARDYKKTIKSAIVEIAREIGEDLLNEGGLVIACKNEIGGIIITATIFCAKKNQPESLDGLCEKIWNMK